MADAAPREEKFALTSSRGFPDWLAATGGSLAFTTYQAGKLFLLGSPSAKGDPVRCTGGFDLDKVRIRAGVDHHFLAAARIETVTPGAAGHRGEIVEGEARFQEIVARPAVEQRGEDAAGAGYGGSRADEKGAPGEYPGAPFQRNMRTAYGLSGPSSSSSSSMAPQMIRPSTIAPMM